MLVVGGFDCGHQGTALIRWKVRGVNEFDAFFFGKATRFLKVKRCGFHVLRTVVIGKLNVTQN